MHPLQRVGTLARRRSGLALRADILAEILEVLRRHFSVLAQWTRRSRTAGRLEMSLLTLTKGRWQIPPVRVSMNRDCAAPHPGWLRADRTNRRTSAQSPAPLQ